MKKYLFIICFLLFSLAATAQGTQKINGLRFTPKAAPGTPVDGEVYYDSTTKKTYQWNGTSWIDWSGGGVTSVAGKTGAVTLVGADIGNTPIGNIAATNVQSAINELETEKGGLANANSWLSANSFAASPRVQTYLSLLEGSSTDQVSGYSAVSHWAGNRFRFEGANQTFASFLDFPDTMAADRTYTFQPASGTVAFLSDITGTPSPNSVTSAMIVNGTIATVDLGSAVVTSTNIANEAIGKEKLKGITTTPTDGQMLVWRSIGDKFEFQTPSTTPADNSVTSAKIVDGTIALADLSATGTKNITTFYRGDNTFGVPLNMGNSDLATSAARKYTIGSGVSFSFRDFLDAPIFSMDGAGGAPTFYDELTVPTPTVPTSATPKSYVDANNTAATTSYDNLPAGQSSNTNVQTMLEALELADVGVIKKASGSQDIQKLYVNTEAAIAAAALPSTTLALCTDCPPATSETGTALSMNGYYQRDDRTTDTATWTLASLGKGGLYEILINAATAPTVTGAAQLTNTQAFIPNVDMVLTIKNVGGIVKYFYTQW